MDYWTIILWVIIIILLIITAILVTVSIDNLARLPIPTDPFNERVLDTVTSLGSFVVIFLIFLIALSLICAILAYYYDQINSVGNWLYFFSIAFIILTLGTLILEIYTYRELLLFKRTPDDQDIIDSSDSNFLWAIALTVLVFILSFFTLI